MRNGFLISGVALALMACEPTTTTPTVAKGPPIEILEAGRKLDTVRVAMRYKDGSAIPAADTSRAMARAMQVACQAGEQAIADTTSRRNGVLTANVFCVQVVKSNQVVDGTPFKGA